MSGNEIVDKFSYEYLYHNYITLNRGCRSLQREFKMEPSEFLTLLNTVGIEQRKRTCKPRDIVIGQVFERLTVKRLIRDEKNRRRYECDCECGNKTVVFPGALSSGGTRSCGCLAKDINHNKGKKFHPEISESYWHVVLRSAKERSLDFSITLEYAWKIFLNQNRKCALSGMPIIFRPSKKEFILQTASLDRIDSSLGYIEGNVQWVHKDVNRMKQNFPDERYIEICKLVAENHNHS